MPFRTDPIKFPGRTKIQFITSAAMPHLIYQACKKTNTVSNTVYCQRALAEALARDLNLDLDQVLADLPMPRGSAKHLFNPDMHTMRRVPHRIGPGNTVEDIPG